MKNVVRRLAAMTLVLVFLTGMMVVPAEAEATTSERYNIMVVLDGSGSLVREKDPTDPTGMRYELMGDLLGILENDGHNVGAIVFSGNHGKYDDSDSAMLDCIRLNTGLLSLDDVAPDGSLPKEYLMKQIYNASVDSNSDGTTDIGTALLVAAQTLKEAQEKNGLESRIFLFADGCTALNSLKISEKSIENRNAATHLMSENNIKVMGAFLNKDGRIQSDEIKDIVCAANHITTNDPMFTNSYAELTDAASCHEAAVTMMSFLGLIGPEPVLIDHDIDDRFIIPGIGVEEFNIRLISNKGEDFPNLEVSLTDPTGKVYEGTSLNGLCTSSRTYRIYKLEKPMAGEWRLVIRLPKGVDVRYIYSQVISVDLDAVIQTSLEPADFHVNGSADFQGLLKQKGQVITDPSCYQSFECDLVIKSGVTGEDQVYKIQPGSQNEFIQNIQFDKYGPFTAKLKFHCGNVIAESDPLSYELINRVPVFSSQYKEHFVKNGLFQPSSSEFVLDGLVSDVEDGQNLAFSVNASGTTVPADSFRLQDSSVIFDHAKVSDGYVCLTATDSQGGQAEMKIVVKYENVTVRYLTTIVMVLVILALIALIIIRRKNSHHPDGRLNVSFYVEQDGTPRFVSLKLPVPACDTVTKTNLKALLDKALQGAMVKTQNGVTAAEMQAYVAKHGTSLSAVRVYAAIKKVNRSPKGAIGVRYGKKTVLLYDSAEQIPIENQPPFTLEFQAKHDSGGSGPFGGRRQVDLNGKKRPQGPFGDTDVSGKQRRPVTVPKKEAPAGEDLFGSRDASGESSKFRKPISFDGKDHSDDPF